VTRGLLVESRHRGAVAVCDADGNQYLALGDVETPAFPRSAVKAMQAIPLVESGAADAFDLDDTELAISCASHSGDKAHLATVRGLLAKARLKEAQLACGVHWPMSERASEELIRAGKNPSAIHNNCSGKHAGMLATAVYRGVDPTGYERPEHVVQEDIRRVLSEICGVPLDRHDMGIDGCSVPTFALPLAALAAGFARLGSGKGLTGARKEAAGRLVRACIASPALVAGEGRFDTVVMRGLGPNVFSKGGAEGVHCASLPALGLGIAVKIDDGTKRGAEHVLARLLSELVPGADRVLQSRIDGELRNWLGLKVGRVRPSPVLASAAKSLSSAKG